MVGMLLVLLYAVIGGLVGLGAGHLMSARAFSWYGDLVLGVIGGLVGGLVFSAVFGTLRLGGVGDVLAAILVPCALVAVLHVAFPRGLTRAQGPSESPF